MIAPVNFDKELTLYLYVSELFQEQFGVNQDDVPEDTELPLPGDWWSVWRAEQIHFEDDFSWVLFTNAKTLFSFCYRAYRDDYESITKEFEHGFLSSLKASGVQLPPQVSTDLVLMTGESDELIDSMNCLAEQFLADIYERDASRDDAETRLWSIPCQDIDYDLPSEVFLRELKANPPFGAEVISPDRDVPFL
ncbi:MAG: hypothetical protein ACSHYA_00225 [Opitutaceae bacterium]